MSEFQANYLEIAPYELVRYLLKESGQENADTVNPTQLLEFLKLDCEIIDLKKSFTNDVFNIKQTPRAVLSFSDRLIVIDKVLKPNRSRFSVLHEIAHYVLPSHQNELYVCDDKDIDSFTHITFEKEANDFAAELLFLGNRFVLQANSEKICALTVKKLAERYQASFESTARRLVEKNIRPCMFIVFKESIDKCGIDLNLDQKCGVNYCIASKSFKTRYFTEVSGEVPADVVLHLTKTNRDIAYSIRREIKITTKTMNKLESFDIEYFTNSYNIFAFVLPNT